MSRRNLRRAQHPGMPTRKMPAGPSKLSTQTAPGAIRKSIALASGINPALEEDDDDDEPESAIPEVKITIEGNITLNSTIDGHKKLTCCKYNEEFDYLATGDTDGRVILYQSGTEDFVLSLVDEEVARSPVTSIKHRPVSKNWPISNVFICTYTNGFVKGWNYNFRQVLYTIKEDRQTLGVVYHSQWPKFVTFGDDSKVFLYDEESRTQERVLQNSKKPNAQDGHTSRICAACFHPRSMYELITAGMDRMIYFWDLRQPHATKCIQGVYMTGEGLDINIKGTQILTCTSSRDGPLQIYDYGSGKLVGKVKSGQSCGQLYTGKFASKTYAIAGGIEPNSVHVLDYLNYTSVAHIEGLPGSVCGLDMCPKKETDPKKVPNEFAALPSVAFISGNKLYQIDFY